MSEKTQRADLYCLISWVPTLVAAMPKVPSEVFAIGAALAGAPGPEFAVDWTTRRGLVESAGVEFVVAGVAVAEGPARGFEAASVVAAVAAIAELVVEPAPASALDSPRAYQPLVALGLGLEPEPEQLVALAVAPLYAPYVAAGTWPLILSPAGEYVAHPFVLVVEQSPWRDSKSSIASAGS